MYDYSFPLRLYLQQLFCPDIYVKFINPLSFWRRYRINHLQTCWEFNTVQYLERCCQSEYQPTCAAKLISLRVQSNNQISENFSQIQHSQSIFWQKTPQNTIFISQPSFELKYRGVTYLTSPIVVLDGNKLKTQPSQLASPNPEKKSTDFNNNNTSQKSNNIS